ncbi:MAG: adenylosuccinate synthetase [Candidatus Margulisiibacteriota bacterium]
MSSRTHKCYGGIEMRRLSITAPHLQGMRAGQMPSRPIHPEDVIFSHLEPLHDTKMRREMSVVVGDGGAGDGGKAKHVDAIGGRFLETSPVPPTDFKPASGPGDGHCVVGQFSNVYKQVPALLGRPGARGHLLGLGLANGYSVAGSVIAPDMFFMEMRNFIERLGGAPLAGRLTVSPKCGILLPAHRALNRMIEAMRLDSFSSTGEGVGEMWRDILGLDLDPAHAFDWILQSTATKTTPVLTVADLFDLSAARKKLEQILAAKKALAMQLGGIYSVHYNAEYFDVAAQMDKLAAWQAGFRQFVNCDKAGQFYADPAFVRHLIEIHAPRIYELSQGMLLHRLWGYWPRGGRKLCGPDAVMATTGLSREEIGHVAMVIRLYRTDHGKRSVPTEVFGSQYDVMRDNVGASPFAGHFRVGWLDLRALEYAIELAQPDSLVIGNIDRMKHLPIIKFGVGYHWHGTEDRLMELAAAAGKELAIRGRAPQLETFYTDRLSRPGAIEDCGNGKLRLNVFVPVEEILKDVEPIYAYFDGCSNQHASFAGIRQLDDLTGPLSAFRDALLYVENFTGVPLSAVSTGEMAEDTFLVRV